MAALPGSCHSEPSAGPVLGLSPGWQHPPSRGGIVFLSSGCSCLSELTSGKTLDAELWLGGRGRLCHPLSCWQYWLQVATGPQRGSSVPPRSQAPVENTPTALLLPPPPPLNSPGSKRNEAEWEACEKNIKESACGTALYIIYKMKMRGPSFKKAGKVSLEVLKHKAFYLSLVVSLICHHDFICDVMLSQVYMHTYYLLILAWSLLFSFRLHRDGSKCTQNSDAAPPRWRS